MRFLSVFLLLTLFGCNLRPSDQDLFQHMVVQTDYDANTAFSFYSTFTLSPDTLGLASNLTSDTLITDDYASAITTALKSNMMHAGYTFLTKKSDPDLGLAAYVVQNYSVHQQVSYPGYYSGYYGYGYGGYYGYPYVTTYSTSTSTLVVNLIDLKNRDAQNRLKVIWKVYIGDLEHSIDSQQKVLEAIDQAFIQSSYLHK